MPEPSAVRAIRISEFTIGEYVCPKRSLVVPVGSGNVAGVAFVAAHFSWFAVVSVVAVGVVDSVIC